MLEREDDGAAFYHLEGETYRPSWIAQGPWRPGTLHGRAISGAMAHAVERRYLALDQAVARMTVDLYRPAPREPLTIETLLVRDGRRIRVVDAALVISGNTYAQGRFVILRHGEQPDGARWNPGNWDVPPPEALELRDPRGQRLNQYEIRPIGESGPGVRHRSWIRESRPFIEGEEPSALVRLAATADYTSGLTAASPGALLGRFVNADITLHIARLPEGEWIGAEAATHLSEHGVGFGAAYLYDRRGPIAMSSVVSVSSPAATGWGQGERQD